MTPKTFFSVFRGLFLYPENAKFGRVIPKTKSINMSTLPSEADHSGRSLSPQNNDRAWNDQGATLPMETARSSLRAEGFFRGGRKIRTPYLCGRSRKVFPKFYCSDKLTEKNNHRKNENEWYFNSVAYFNGFSSHNILSGGWNPCQWIFISLIRLWIIGYTECFFTAGIIYYHPAD